MLNPNPRSQNIKMRKNKINRVYYFFSDTVVGKKRKAAEQLVKEITKKLRER